MFQMTSAGRHPIEVDRLKEVHAAMGGPQRCRLFFVVPKRAFAEFHHQSYTRQKRVQYATEQDRQWCRQHIEQWVLVVDTFEEERGAAVAEHRAQAPVTCGFGEPPCTSPPVPGCKRCKVHKGQRVR